jgi:formate hydrogenlyase subunit 3/multisubunit Na+/H+ antiporter MnhD subunit
MSAIGFPLALALHATGVALALVLRRRPAACRWVAFLASAGGSQATFVLGASVLADGRAIRGVLFANPAAGVTVGCAVDPLSAWFLVAWELMSLATAALVATDHESRPSRRSAFLYLAMSHLGTGCLVAGLYHVLNHAAFKGLLFLGASGVIAATGTRRIEELGSLAHRPRTAGLFLLGSAAIAGLPLLNGFASEWLVFQALLHGFFFAERLTRIVLPLGGALLALTSALAAACFVKAFALTFLARPRSRAAAEATESPAQLGGLP